jgi:hypothetical protein
MSRRPKRSSWAYDTDLISQTRAIREFYDGYPADGVTRLKTSDFTGYSPAVLEDFLESLQKSQEDEQALPQPEDGAAMADRAANSTKLAGFIRRLKSAVIPNDAGRSARGGNEQGGYEEEHGEEYEEEDDGEQEPEEEEDEEQVWFPHDEEEESDDDSVAPVQRAGARNPVNKPRAVKVANPRIQKRTKHTPRERATEGGWQKNLLLMSAASLKQNRESVSNSKSEENFARFTVRLMHRPEACKLSDFESYTIEDIIPLLEKGVQAFAVALAKAKIGQLLPKELPGDFEVIPFSRPVYDIKYHNSSYHGATVKDVQSGLRARFFVGAQNLSHEWEMSVLVPLCKMLHFRKVDLEPLIPVGKNNKIRKSALQKHVKQFGTRLTMELMQLPTMSTLSDFVAAFTEDFEDTLLDVVEFIGSRRPRRSAQDNLAINAAVQRRHGVNHSHSRVAKARETIQTENTKKLLQGVLVGSGGGTSRKAILRMKRRIAQGKRARRRTIGPAQNPNKLKKQARGGGAWKRFQRW